MLEEPRRDILRRYAPRLLFPLRVVSGTDVYYPFRVDTCGVDARGFSCVWREFLAFVEYCASAASVCAGGEDTCDKEVPLPVLSGDELACIERFVESIAAYARSATKWE